MKIKTVWLLTTATGVQIVFEAERQIIDYLCLYHQQPVTETKVETIRNLYAIKGIAIARAEAICFHSEESA